MRSTTLSLCVAAVALAACGPPKGHVHGWEADYLESRHLMVPVEGIAPEKVPDTFTAARSNGRSHQATDILAPRGTRVLSADDGKILKLHRSKDGGITIYAQDPRGQFIYYYAHLDHYADGIHEGQSVDQGQVIGYVGTTGNAPKNTPHLHFQVMRTHDPSRWWDGKPVDPKPFFSKTGKSK